MVIRVSSYSQRGQKLAVELVFDLHVLRLQHPDAFLLVPLVDFFVHGLFLDNVLGDVETFASALLVQHGCPVCGF